MYICLCNERLLRLIVHLRKQEAVHNMGYVFETSKLTLLLDLTMQ